ncbi:MAG: DUF4339 domain-containing protein [Gemmataceae bacterium]|nr:DUF4339 domain-containing protein [Gemmataceae bacterium]MDW8264779.1 DUF4339 domain-containing protein [Gemmataceae bacterium]
MAGNWFVQSHGRQMGPLTAAQLRQLARSGKLRPTDMVRRDGQAKWVAVTAVPGLLEAASGVPAATPAAGTPSSPAVHRPSRPWLVPVAVGAAVLVVAAIGFWTVGKWLRGKRVEVVAAAPGAVLPPTPGRSDDIPPAPRTGDLLHKAPPPPSSVLSTAPSLPPQRLPSIPPREERPPVPQVPVYPPPQFTDAPGTFNRTTGRIADMMKRLESIKTGGIIKPEMAWFKPTCKAADFVANFGRPDSDTPRAPAGRTYTYKCADGVLTLMVLPEAEGQLRIEDYAWMRDKPSRSETSDALHTRIYRRLRTGDFTYSELLAALGEPDGDAPQAFHRRWTYLCSDGPLHVVLSFHSDRVLVADVQRK